MLKKRQKKQISLILGAGLLAFLAGIMFSAPAISKFFGQWFVQGHAQPEKLSEASKAKSDVLPLVLQSPNQRAAKLSAIAKGNPSLDSDRARYLLASDLIDQKKGKEALSLLDGLEDDYSVLAPYVLLKQAQAEDILGDDGKASDFRHKVIDKYPKSPAIVKALYLIAQPKEEDKAIAEFPSHPLTWDIIHKRLQQNPDQPQLELILAKYAYDQPGILNILDQLASSPSLKPEEWETVATAYWQNDQFGKAATAYAKAPQTSRNLYRIGRGLQLGSQKQQAAGFYEKVVQQFPDTKEAGLALIHLAETTTSSKDAIPYLDQAVSKFPDKAGEALVKKIEILSTLKDQKGVAQAQQLLLDKYGNTEEAAKYRWKEAQQKDKARDYKGAWELALPILTNNVDSILAPRAGFWIGKWATKLGKQQQAKQAYDYVISQFPYSYYAWRSAATVGMDVGNFNTVRQMAPQLVQLLRPVPTAGSETFKELYLLGQDHNAWLQWEAEFVNKNQPSVAEKFSDGLMRLAKGENLPGIDEISKLEDEDTAQEKAQYHDLSKQTIYWQARYPFPYFQEIENWSQQRKLNPLLVTSLIRQESRFDPKAKSPVGAVGLMQVLPSTAKIIAAQTKTDIKNVDLLNPNDNIMLGTLYLQQTHQQYNNNSLLAVASYNAGPGNVGKWLQTLPKGDSDEFVEAIPFDETKNYVRQVFGNYWNYLRLYNPQTNQALAKYSTSQPTLPRE